MQKMQFTTGMPIPPELLNALQNPTFSGTDEDAGHLPLPPDYDKKQQCKTIHVYGESNTVNLDGWPYNAVIVVHRYMNGETPVYPRTLKIRCTNTTGAIVIIPELDQNGRLSVSAIGAGDSAEYATTTLKQKDIAIVHMLVVDSGSNVECFIHTIQAGNRVEYANVMSSIFSVDGGDSHKATIYIDGNGTLIVDTLQNSTIPLLSIRFPLEAQKFSSGTENSNNEGYVEMGASNGQASFKANSAGGQKSIGYSTENGVMTLSEKTVGGADYLKTYYGSGYIQNEKHLAGGKKEVILIGKNVDASFNIIDDNVGVITILHIPSDSEVSLYGHKPKKTCLTASGIAFFELQNGSWVNPSA